MVCGKERGGGLLLTYSLIWGSLGDGGGDDDDGCC